MEPTLKTGEKEAGPNPGLLLERPRGGSETRPGGTRS